MEELKDLGTLYQQIKVQIENWTYEEKELPTQFKSQITIIGDKKIVFHKFSAFASKSNGDSIIIPNQWFYLSKILLPYNEELHKYYDIITNLDMFSLERLDALKNGHLTEREERLIDKKIIDEKNAAKIKRFLTDYNWWHGAKSLGRIQKDYYVSAVLSLSGLINDSSTFVAVICDFLRLYPNLANMLQCTQTSRNTSNKSWDDIAIVSTIQSTGLIYSNTIIKRLAYSLMAKPFVILSGLAGSGKTQLALAFAKCLSEDIEKQVCTVSIGADWTNREPLLGYPNALRSGEYVMPESGVLQLLMRADADPSRPYFLILDEMNLSVVERYFADFLSVMESGENIKLWEGEGDVPKEIALPKNVFIIGTINVDETTYMFSPKVLDRANVIEFKIAPDEMEKYLNEKKDIHLEVAYSACADMAVDFVSKSKAQIEIDNQNEKVILLSFFKELKKVNAEFGYRTINEICRYLYFAHKDENGLKDNNAIDTAILQKLLPKLHGSRKKLAPVLSSMWKLCLKDNKDNSIDSQINKDDFIYPESAEKIQRMYNAVVDNGFTSFAEA